MSAIPRPIRLGVLGLSALILACAVLTYAAANVVPRTGMGQYGGSISALDDLVPATCESMNLQRFAAGNGTLTGTGQRDFLVGGTGADTITGLGARDCLLGSGGNDDLDAGAGADVIYGGDGNDILTGGANADLLYGGAGNDTIYGSGGGDTLDGGPGVDSCYGENGSDTFLNCETIVQ